MTALFALSFKTASARKCYFPSLLQLGCECNVCFHEKGWTSANESSSPSCTPGAPVHVVCEEEHHRNQPRIRVSRHKAQPVLPCHGVPAGMEWCTPATAAALTCRMAQSRELRLPAMADHSQGFYRSSSRVLQPVIGSITSAQCHAQHPAAMSSQSE